MITRTMELQNALRKELSELLSPIEWHNDCFIAGYFTAGYPGGGQIQGHLSLIERWFSGPEGTMSKCISLGMSRPGISGDVMHYFHWIDRLDDAKQALKRFVEDFNDPKMESSTSGTEGRWSGHAGELPR